jgi:hypothetical protein
MSLVALKREYEERRAALIQQLQNNKRLDPATQHQIYGAIKEIENFLRTIDYQLAQEQERNMQVDLERLKPSPIVERTQKAVYHVAHGTKRLFTERIPNAAKRAYTIPKQKVTSYFDKRREEARVRAEIEAEIRARQTNHPVPVRHDAQHPSPYVTLEHPYQELPIEESAQRAETGDVTSGHPNVIEEHEKREAPMTSVNTVKPKPSRKAKRGHQHKPHLKKEKNNRYHRK